MSKDLSTILEEGKFGIPVFPKLPEIPKKGTKAYEKYMNKVIEVYIPAKKRYCGIRVRPIQYQKMTRKEYEKYLHKCQIKTNNALAKYLSDKKKFEKPSPEEAYVTFP